MFRARPHRQEGKIVLYSLWYHHTYRCDDTRYIIQFCPPDDEHLCSKHVEAWNKLIIKFSASSWLILINKWLLSIISSWPRQAFMLCFYESLLTYFLLSSTIIPSACNSPRATISTCPLQSFNLSSCDLLLTTVSCPLQSFILFVTCCWLLFLLVLSYYSSCLFCDLLLTNISSCSL